MTPICSSILGKTQKALYSYGDDEMAEEEVDVDGKWL